MRKFLERISVFGVGVVAVCYLLNFGWGWVEFLPDNLPILGNLDEVAATTILVGVLAYFGIDVTRLFRGVSGYTANGANRSRGRRPVAALPARSVAATVGAASAATGAGPGRDDHCADD